MAQQAQSPLDQHLAYTGRANDALSTLQDYVLDHGGVLPDGVTQQHADAMGHVADTLDRLVQYVAARSGYGRGA